MYFILEGALPDEPLHLRDEPKPGSLGVFDHPWDKQCDGLANDTTTVLDKTVGLLYFCQILTFQVVEAPQGNPVVPQGAWPPAVLATGTGPGTAGNGQPKKTHIA